VTIWQYQQPAVLLSAHFPFLVVLMIQDEDN